MSTNDRPTQNAPAHDARRRQRQRRSSRTLRRATHRQGVTAVEFAMVAPAFFILLIASFEFGRLHVMRHTADNAAYEAARLAMVPGATAAEAIAEANRILAIVGARSANITVTPPVLGPNVDQITVGVQVPMDQNALLIPRFTAGAVIRTSSTLRTERVAGP